ncbi:hypothetical protein EMIT048CA2_320020 [Pseudomonas chlororaphis]
MPLSLFKTAAYGDIPEINLGLFESFPLLFQEDIYQAIVKHFMYDGWPN